MKNILYITMHSPFEYSSGANQRSTYLLRAMLTVGKVDVISFTSDQFPVDINDENCRLYFFGNIKEERKGTSKRNFNLFNKNTIRARNKVYSAMVNEAIKIKSYDYVVVRYFTLVLECGLEDLHNLIIDVDDLPEEVYTSILKKNPHLSLFKRVFYHFKRFFVRYYTNIIIKKALHSFFPNEDYIKFSNSSYLPNIPYSEGRTSISDTEVIQRSVMFVGLMSYEPNVNGVSAFLNNVWSRVLDKYPDASFSIVGGGLDEKIKAEWSAINGVSLRGYVEDLEKEYFLNDLVVVPIYEGSGTNIKVLESMSFGKVTIVSDFALRGFKVHMIDNNNVLIADDFEDYANKIIELFDNSEFKKKLGINAKNTIDKFYSFDVFKEKVQKIISIPL